MTQLQFCTAHCLFVCLFYRVLLVHTIKRVSVQWWSVNTLPQRKVSIHVGVLVLHMFLSLGNVQKSTKGALSNCKGEK